MFDSSGYLLNPGAVSTAAFSPDSIASLQYWWDVDDATTATSTMTAWVDKISSLAFTLTGAPAEGTSVNGGKIFRMTPDDWGVTASNVNLQYVTAAANALHIFYVFGDVDVATNGSQVSNLLSSADLPNVRAGDATYFEATHRDVNGTTGTATNHAATNPPFGFGSSAYHVMEYIIDEAGGQIDIVIDGVTESTCTHYDDVFTDNTIKTNDQSASFHVSWDCGDILIFHDNLTGTDLTNVRDYLQNKFITT